MTVTDYPDWQTPQAHATQIAGTGVPLLRGTNQLTNNAGVTVAGAATAHILQSGVVKQPGYEMTLEAFMPASSGTIPFLHLAMQWWDSATGLFGARRDVVATCGNASGNFLTYYIRGPMHSDMFNIDVVNLDPAVTATITYVVNQTSHVYEQDQALQYAYAATAPNGFTNPAGVPTTDLLVFENPTIAASGAVTVLCALYSGDVILNIDNSTSAQSVTVNLLDAPGFATAHANGSIFKVTVTAGAELTMALTLPYSPVALKMTNTSTAASITPIVTMIGQQH